MTEFQFKQWKRGDMRAPHKPLLFLYALGQWQQGRESVRWVEAQPAMELLLQLFGRPMKRQSPENPWARLVNDGVWVVSPPPKLQNRNYSPQALADADSTGALSEELRERLRARPDDLVTIASTIASKRKRDIGFATVVIRNYGHRCAICGYNLQLDNQVIGLEAAHIRWHAYDGPDIVENGLALCSLHHKLFDFGAFALQDDLSILVSRNLNGNSVPEIARFHGADIQKHSIDFIPPEITFLRWQRAEVFKQ
jgi:putative restriction endonuclease